MFSEDQADLTRAEAALRSAHIRFHPQGRWDMGNGNLHFALLNVEAR